MDQVPQPFLYLGATTVRVLRQAQGAAPRVDDDAEASPAHDRFPAQAFAAQASQGRGAFSFGGRMIDAPIVLRARQLIRRAECRTRKRSN